jgi:diguanylate cyclase (GGDEF)-like protein/PAS domain S-box-containing protein
MGYGAAIRGSTAGSDSFVGELELAARARERMRETGGRRELRVEAAVAAGFVLAAAVVFWALGGGDTDVWRAAWLAVVCACLVRVEFEVGEGCTRPVQLVLASMLVLLPAGAVPLAVAVGHVAAQLPGVVGGRIPPRRLLMGVADSWFSLAPAIVVGVLGLSGAWPACTLVVLAAVVAQFAVDFVVSAVRVRFGAGYELSSLLRPFAWVWLVDLMLIPIGLLVAVVAQAAPVAVGGVLPLAVLLVVFARERTGRIENAVALQRVAQEGEERLQSIVQNASDVIAIVRPDGMVTTLTGSVEAVFGADWETVQGRSLFEHVHPDDGPRVHAFLGGVAEKAIGESQEAEWRMRYPDGSWRHVSAVATNLVTDPRVEGIVITARDVEARKAFEEQLRHRAFHDPLTALANRALFYDRIEHALARERREEGQVAILYLDLDDFKRVNDRFGHAAGDRLLIDVAGRLRACVRSVDTAARLGGDEFGVLLEAVVGPNEPVRTAERALAALSKPFDLQGETIALSVSVGIAISDAEDRGVDELLRRADLAMYSAKRNGKRRLELYDAELAHPDPAAAPARGAWFNSIDAQREEVVSVLESDESLAIAFQPIMDLRTGRVAGYEALSRFTDALQRPPSAWFAQAHRCGLGYELEAKALTAALAVPGRPEGTYLTVNLSPSALSSDAVAGALPQRLDGLVIEITENEVITNDPRNSAALDDVRRRGARLAVDDTGSGYAGLTQVMRLAPDIIKLDRTIVTGVATDPIKAALIESFVRYARESNATVCAEGVEDLHDLAHLADLDVTYGQGYGIGRPGRPWGTLEDHAAETCRVSFTATLQSSTANVTSETQDHGLEALAECLSMASSATDLLAVLEPIARELHADAVHLATAHGTLTHPSRSRTPDRTWSIPPTQIRHELLKDPQVLATTAESMTALGFGSRLQVPVRCRGTNLGSLEIYSIQERPWTRFEIRRARIIANAIGGTLAHVIADAPGPDVPGARSVTVH